MSASRGMHSTMIELDGLTPSQVVDLLEREAESASPLSLKLSLHPDQLPRMRDGWSAGHTLLSTLRRDPASVPFMSDVSYTRLPALTRWLERELDLLHQQISRLESIASDSRCPDCGKAMAPGDWPFCPHERTPKKGNAKVRQSDRSVVMQHPETDEVAFIPRNDLPMPDYYQRRGFEFRDFAHLHEMDRFCREHGLANWQSEGLDRLIDAEPRNIAAEVTALEDEWLACMREKQVTYNLPEDCRVKRRPDFITDCVGVASTHKEARETAQFDQVEDRQRPNPVSPMPESFGGM